MYKEIGQMSQKVKMDKTNTLFLISSVHQPDTMFPTSGSDQLIKYYQEENKLIVNITNQHSK